MQRLSIIFPIGKRRFRAYVASRHGMHAPLSGAKDQARFVELSVATGAPVEWFSGATAIGPLASFDAPDSWAEHPHRDGVVLIGDAAAASDPCFGCGLSLTLRDVRVLRDCISEKQDYAEAAHAYAAEHDLYYSRLYRIHGWFRDLWFGAGADAEALRARTPSNCRGSEPYRGFYRLGPRSAERRARAAADVRRGLALAPVRDPHAARRRFSARSC